MMIKGYSCTSSTGYAIAMYVDMLRGNVKPNSYTFPFLLKEFTLSVGSGIGKGIHCHMYELYRIMSLLFRCYLSACSKLKDGDGCKHVHGYVKDGRVESNWYYITCGEMDAALANLSLISSFSI
ncbi:hypothetical protein L6452_35843 [Arctium lappa]|uniref:Uncharacterized protein n=1 Tax=Arctium lappa TaxID=4217 RepID=A0ACB8Y8F9_ARCLA|nr:hypothetical protein L6452_35843 [Arctium lappa]